jgi:hypothetical protein
LEDCLTARYGRTFSLGTKYVRGGTAARSYRITDEELREQIHFPIERES